MMSWVVPLDITRITDVTSRRLTSALRIDPGGACNTAGQWIAGEKLGAAGSAVM